MSTNNTTTVTLSQVKPLIEMLWEGGVTSFLHSSPGTGKSSLARQLAEEHNLFLIDVRMTEMEPSDMSGIPTIVDGRSQFNPFHMFPLETDTIPEGYSGYLILLDEFNSAHEQVMGAAYRLILDRQVGQYNLHPEVRMIACGNLIEDNSIVNPLPTAIISRMAHFYVRLDNEAFMEWAAGKLDIRITSFLGAFPRHLDSFDPKASTPYAISRTWEMLSNTIKGKKYDNSYLPLVASLVGQGIAQEFQSFLNLYKDLPSIATILDDPSGVSIGSNLSVRWALMGMVTHHMTEDNYQACQTFLRRLSLELQVCALREIKARNPSLMTAHLRPWKLELGKTIYA